MPYADPAQKAAHSRAYHQRPEWRAYLRRYLAERRRTQTPEDRDRVRAYYRDRWAKLRAAGLCAHCGVEPSVRFARCWLCRERINDRLRAKRAQRAYRRAQRARQRAA